MSNQSVTTAPKSSALAVMAGRYNVEPSKLLDTLKGTVFKGATNDELMALVVVANEYQLNPFLKQIYAFPCKGGGITPVVSIDGWIAVMNRREDFDGIEFEMVDKDGRPHACTAIVRVKGRANPIKVTEYFDECYRGTEPWKAMPRRMLRHKACAQAVRLAFGMAGVYDEDEARSMSAAVDPVALAKPINSSAPQFAPVDQIVPAEVAQTQLTDDQVPGAEVPAKPQAQTTIARDLKTLRMFLKDSKHDEAALLQIWRDKGTVDASLASLDEVAEMQPSAIHNAINPWSKTLDTLSQSKSMSV